jgi:predicted nucleotidyltransferase
MHHHEQTIAAFTDHHAALPDTLGVVVVGSVARGDERPDSDVDVYLVITDDAYAAAGRAGAIAYVSHTGVAYEGGYVDVKLASPGYLRAAVDHGDDPTRASFDRGRVRFDRSGELPGLLARMTELPDAAWADRVYNYRAQLSLYGGYFLGQAEQRGDRFLLQHAAVHASLAAGRCALAQHHRFFSGQKYLTRDVADLNSLPTGFLAAWTALVDAPTTAGARRMIEIVDGWFEDSLTTDESLSAFIVANELAWLRHEIPPEYW